MFTGIITYLGTVVTISDTGLEIAVDNALLAELAVGASIAVNGVCLTVRHLTNDAFQVDVMPETFARTMFEKLQQGDRVNLELPLRANARLDGHFVQGHIDGTGTLHSIELQGTSIILTLNYPAALRPYLVEKGSVTLNGISLTVMSVDATSLRVGIIPHTWEHTMLNTVQVGTTMNIEVDIIAKYVERMISPYLTVN